MANAREEFKKNVDLKKITTKKSKLDSIYIKQGKLKAKFMSNLERYKKDVALTQSDSKQSIKFAFVVFRSMKGKEYVKNAYKIGKWSKCCKLSNPCCFSVDKRKEYRSKHIFKKWP